MSIPCSWPSIAKCKSSQNTHIPRFQLPSAAARIEASCGHRDGGYYTQQVTEQGKGETGSANGGKRANAEHVGIYEASERQDLAAARDLMRGRVVGQMDRYGDPKHGAKWIDNLN
jgi:hypothetical protein